MTYNYNEISKIYDKVRKAEFELVKLMIEKAGINSSSRVIEIGCGTANYLSLLYDITKAEVWGVDSSEGMLKRASEKCKSAVFTLGNAEKLSGIPGSCFDLAYMVDVIHHIGDIDSMFHSIRGVLRKDAAVIIFSDSHDQIKGRLTTKYFPETLEYELKRYPDKKDIMDSLINNGFHKIETGILDLGEDSSYGPRLMEIASKRGYSMFGPLSEDSIRKGIEGLRQDMEKGPVVYHQTAPYVIAYK